MNISSALNEREKKGEREGGEERETTVMFTLIAVPKLTLRFLNCMYILKTDNNHKQDWFGKQIMHRPR